MMVGPDRSSRGGISSLINEYISSGVFEQFSVSYYSTYKDGTISRKISFYLKNILIIAINIRSYKIVHIHTAHGWSFRRLFIVLWLAICFGKKTIFHIHSGLFVPKYLATSAFEKKLIRWSIKKSDIIITLSSEWEAKLKGICPAARIEVLENAIDLDRFNDVAAGLALSPPYRILFIGWMGEEKGVYDIIESASYLPQSRYKFILAGEGELAEVKEKIEEKGFQDRFEITGWIQGNQKIKLLQKADLFLLPSYYEGLPMSILEAMAVGLPVVATDIGGIPSAVEHGGNGYLVTPGNPLMLAEAIERVFSDAGKWNLLSQRSRQIVEEKFSVKTVKRNLKRIYISLLTKN